MTTLPNKQSQHPVGHDLIQGSLSRPRLEFDLTAEIAGLCRDETWLKGTGRSSKTLVKYPDLRIVLITMKANTLMHEHTTDARISVHTISGHIRLRLPEDIVDLPAHHLLTLEHCIPHDVEAAEDSAFLLTLSWPSGKAQ